MNDEQSPLRMKHTERGFWMYLAAYLCFFSGVLIMVGELLEWAFGGERPDLAAGSSVLLIAAFILLLLENTRLKERIRELERKTQAHQAADSAAATQSN